MWNQDPSYDWSQYDAVIVRSTSDYYESSTRLTAFIETLKRIENAGVLLMNPAGVIEANSTKRYLMSLPQYGIKTLATLLVTRESLCSCGPELLKKGWSDIVIKPLVSAGAHNTFRMKPSELEYFDESCFASDSEILIQPTAPEIFAEGEWSFIFIDGHYSHTVLKRPEVGDFRVQSCHGGDYTCVEPDKWMIQEATRILNQAQATGLLYVRIDVIRRGHDLIVMEIELIEPDLYWAYYPASKLTFAQAIDRRISKSVTDRGSE